MIATLPMTSDATSSDQECAAPPMNEDGDGLVWPVVVFPVAVELPVRTPTPPAGAQSLVAI